MQESPTMLWPGRKCSLGMYTSRNRFTLPLLTQCAGFSGGQAAILERGIAECDAEHRRDVVAQDLTTEPTLEVPKVTGPYLLVSVSEVLNRVVKAGLDSAADTALVTIQIVDLDLWKARRKCPLHRNRAVRS